MKNLSPEESLQLDCLTFLKMFAPHVLCWHTPNGMALGNGKNRFAYMAKMKKLGLLPGVPDLVLHWQSVTLFMHGDAVIPKGFPRTAYVELKDGKNPLTDSQMDVAWRLDKLGVPTFLCRDIGEFIGVCIELEVPMKGGMYGAIRTPQIPLVGTTI